MDRRRFLARAGLLTAGGAAGAGAGFAAGPVLTAGGTDSADGAPGGARVVRGDGDVSYRGVRQAHRAHDR